MLVISRNNSLLLYNLCSIHSIETQENQSYTNLIATLEIAILYQTIPYDTRMDQRYARYYWW